MALRAVGLPELGQLRPGRAHASDSLTILRNYEFSDSVKPTYKTVLYDSYKPLPPFRSSTGDDLTFP